MAGKRIVYELNQGTQWGIEVHFKLIMQIVLTQALKFSLDFAPH